MNNMIKVGDLVVLCNATGFWEFNGTIGTVVDGLKMRRPRHRFIADLKSTYRCYQVRLSNGLVVSCSPHQVRKLLPPGDREADEHDECIAGCKGENLTNAVPVE